MFIFFWKKIVIYFHNVASGDFFAEFIFAIGSYQKKFTEFNLGLVSIRQKSQNLILQAWSKMTKI